MSCPKTDYLLQEYFSEDLSQVARNELDRHLVDCADCNAELESVLIAQKNLENWDEQRVPHWDRGLELFRQEHRADRPVSFSWLSWQWVPTGASLAMLCVLLFNVSVVSNESGFSISFAGANADLTTQLAEFEQSQRAQMDQLVARVESRQDSNNVQLLQAVLEQTQQSTADSFDQMYTYFEQQRLLDLQDMRAGYEQLVDSDYETIRSLQQLVTYVGYQGDIQ
ncbi:MAG: hypothetical protein DHS20C12_19870 [Pseudohongiella sp.]|nr:MAG: hypothetical protein DHS20C12_19870 [Pseudohongiella sp.]